MDLARLRTRLAERFALDRATGTSGGVPGGLIVRSPIDGRQLACLRPDTPADIDAKIARAAAAFRRWRSVPAPVRGALVRQFGDELRRAGADLADLITLECGKIPAESRGEVQEVVDMADLAVGLSRQLYGLTIASERPGHHLIERWHPLGPVGVVTAFNFPVAVWGWNFCLALVCGDPVIWKPSERTPLTALACQSLFQRCAAAFPEPARDLLQVVVGGAEAAQRLAADARLPLISATGSTAMGRALAPMIAARLGRALLELGGNNAAIVTASADLELARRAVVFAGAGTAGQRCTTLRRLIVHEDVYDRFVHALRDTYARLRVGDPFQDGTLVGPLIGADAFAAMRRALDRARAAGAAIHGGERRHAERWPDAYYVAPALVETAGQEDFVREETFAPILYVMRYRTWDEALALNNDVPQGLSSAIFATDLRDTERFISAAGSDCGIVNVNCGPSGAEIGGAFGGEKDTGGGREAGSDSWKAYMRRMTSTINYSADLPLAQGVNFDVG